MRKKTDFTNIEVVDPPLEESMERHNSNPPGLILCATNLLTYCVTNLLSYSFMKNEPNFKLTASWPTTPNGSRATGHESRFMQNEPNFTKLMYLKVPKIGNRNSQISYNSLRKSPNFSKKNPKKSKKNTLCKFQTKTHLNPYIAKTYRNIHPKTPFTIHERQVTIHAKQT
jgi:hypothetical protein